MRSGKPDERDRADLVACAHLRDLDTELVDRIFERTQERRYGSGELLIRQGEPGDCLLVLLEGRAKIRVHDSESGSHEIGLFEAGDIFGEMALVTEELRSADVVAETDSRVLALPVRDFHDVAREHVELGMVLTQLIAERLGQTSRDGLGGKTIEGYRIIRCVGRGGMAIVYEAERVEERTAVALKMMSHRLLYDSTALSRFRREARLVQSIRHDNVTSVYERFRAYGTHFLAMEFCDGPSLQQLAAEQAPLPEERVRAIIGQLANALHHVHEQGVVHRDLKPSNVMLTSAGVIKLMDFGAARPNYDISEDTQTLPGAVVGTPVYMAPEQLAAKPVGPSADIYALACMAYELLSGEPLFRADNFVDLVQRKMAFRVPGAARIGPGISDEMHAFVERGLQIDPEKRPDSTAAYSQWAAPFPIDP